MEAKVLSVKRMTAHILSYIHYLDITEKKWLNQYHEKVYNNLGKFLPENERKWLKKVTEPIS